MTMFFSQINVRTGEASYKKKSCNIHVINVNVDKPKMEVDI